MAAKRTILTSLMLGAILFLAACGGSSSPSTHVSSAISIALNPKPSTTTLMVGNSAGIQFTAVVSNDSSNAGVDWAITCPAYTTGGVTGFQPANGSFPCGTLSVAPTMHTASGKPVTYTPPSYFSSGATNVTIVAFATADHAQNVATPVTINSYTSALKGTYVLQVQGTDGTNPFQATGAFVFDGKGNITSGEETFNTQLSPYSSSFTVQGSSGAPSTYFIGADGRGTITLNVQQTSNSSTTLTQNLSFIVLSNAKALVADLGDFGVGGAVTLSGSGTLELQDSTAATTMPSGAYAFVTNGIDSGGNSDVGLYSPLGNVPVPTAIGGVINIDNTGSISSASSLADQDYVIYQPNNGSPIVSPKLFSCPPASLSGTVSPLDSFGSFSVLLVGASCFGQPPNSAGSIQLIGYIVDSTHIRLIESDDTNGSSGFLTAGIAVQQVIPAGGFTVGSLSGNYVFGISGMESESAFTYNNFFFTPPYMPSSFTSAGVVSADGNGNFSGETDTFFLSGAVPAYNGTPVNFTDTPIHGNYAVDAGGIGRILLAPLIFKGGTTPHPSFILYLTGNGNPPLVLWAGANDINFASVGTGETYVQAQNPNTLTFGNSQPYGVNFRAVNNSGIVNSAGGAEPEDDGSGSATSPAQTNGNWTSTIDDAFHNNITIAGGAPLSFSGNFIVSSADLYGRLNGDFIYDLANGGPPPTSQIAYYMIDANHAFFVENDWSTLFFNSGNASAQVGIGYFEQACDVTSATSCQAAADAAKHKPSSQEHKGRSQGNRPAPQR